MSHSRRNLLIVLTLFWLPISWLIASVRPGADWAVTFSETLQIFLPGLFLLILLVGMEFRKAEKHARVVRKDIFGGLDVFQDRSYFHFPLLFETVAVMPAYPLRLETTVDTVDTRTPRLQAITSVRLRCTFEVRDVRVCLTRAELWEERIKQLEASHHVKRAEIGFWPLFFQDQVSRLLDDNLRSTVWTWQRVVEAAPGLAVAPLSKHLPRQPIPQNPTPNQVLENDPYDLSLNREKLARVLRSVTASDAAKWGLVITEIVIEQVVVDGELINKRTRNKPGEVVEAQHKAEIEALEILTRGNAEAEIRAVTVQKVLHALAGIQSFGNLSQDTISSIVRAAMYSDGEMIWKGVLEKSATPPGTVKTA